jgi:hypothetical protein
MNLWFIFQLLYRPWNLITGRKVIGRKCPEPDTQRGEGEEWITNFDLLHSGKLIGKNLFKLLSFPFFHLYRETVRSLNKHEQKGILRIRALYPNFLIAFPTVLHTSLVLMFIYSRYKSNVAGIIALHITTLQWVRKHLLLKAKLYLCLTKQHAMKTYGGVEV